MDITEDQMPPNPSRPPTPEKGIPSKDKPDTGSKPDLINPEEPEEEDEPIDAVPDMDPNARDPADGETIN